MSTHRTDSDRYPSKFPNASDDPLMDRRRVKKPQQPFSLKPLVSRVHNLVDAGRELYEQGDRAAYKAVSRFISIKNPYEEADKRVDQLGGSWDTIGNVEPDMHSGQLPYEIPPRHRGLRTEPCADMTGVTTSMDTEQAMEPFGALRIVNPGRQSIISLTTVDSEELLPAAFHLDDQSEVSETHEEGEQALNTCEYIGGRPPSASLISIERPAVAGAGRSSDFEPGTRPEAITRSSREQRRDAEWSSSSSPKDKEYFFFPNAKRNDLTTIWMQLQTGSTDVGT